MGVMCGVILRHRREHGGDGSCGHLKDDMIGLLALTRDARILTCVCVNLCVFVCAGSRACVLAEWVRLYNINSW